MHRADDRIRVTARLIRTTDEKQLWAGQYDEQLTSIFAVQDAISERVPRELAIRLTAQEEQQVTRRHTDDTGAYEADLKGRF
jgi:adenylate cyclase